jgi:hypothetical protein
MSASARESLAESEKEEVGGKGRKGKGDCRRSDALRSVANRAAAEGDTTGSAPHLADESLEEGRLAGPAGEELVRVVQ